MVTGRQSQAVGIILNIEGRLAVGMVLELSFIIKSMGNIRGVFFLFCFLIWESNDHN